MRGRGLRGLLALGLFLITTCVMVATGSSWVISPIRSIIVGKARKKFKDYIDLIDGFASGTMGYVEFAAARPAPVEW